MRSMTGFGRADAVINDAHFTVEVKSVNHRYLETRFRLPVSLSFLEIPMNETLRGQCERGAFEIILKSRLVSKKGSVFGSFRFVIDELAFDSLVTSLAILSKRFKRELVLTPDALIQSRVLVPTEDEKDLAELWQDLKPMFEKALAALLKMREMEGKRILGVLEQDLSQIQSSLDNIVKEVADQPRLISERLQTRLKKWKLEGVETQRLELEVALLADKADVAEEIARAKGHTQELQATMRKRGGVGRRLDFLLQELNREINTLGAKAVSPGVSHGVVSLKHLIEKLREQVQNVE